MGTPRSRQFVRFALVAALFGQAASAQYVIPYAFHKPIEGFPKGFQVLVVLGDHYRKLTHTRGGLPQFLAQTWHPNPRVFVDGYLKIPWDWYAGELEKHPEIYGHDPRQVTRGLELYESIFDGASNAVIFTEPDDIRKPVAFLRESFPAADGRTQSESHFAPPGEHIFTNSTPRWGWAKAPRIEFEGSVTKLVKLALPVPFDDEEVVIGGKAEEKSYAINPAHLRVLLPNMHLVARAHGFFHYHREPIPTSIQTYRNGRPIPPEMRPLLLQRLDRIGLDCYGSHLLATYTAMGFHQVGHRKDMTTNFLDLYFMEATPDEHKVAMDARAGRLVDRIGTHYLVYQAKLARRLMDPTCASYILASGDPS